MISCRLMLPSPVLRALSLGVFLVTLLLPALASAQTSDINRLIYNLANSEDFRLRTQAALALGASKSERAVAPLCSALGDANTTVRAAAAAALGRLAQRPGQACLEKRLETESSDVVKATIQKAIDAIKGGAGGAEPVFAADSKFYVAVGKTTDKTGRGTPEVDNIVRTAMTAKLAQTSGLVAAPNGETPADAKRRLAKHPGVKAFFLSPSINAPDYANGNLKIKIEVAMLSYPDKNLLGSFSFYLVEPDVAPGSTQNENDLIRTVAEKAVDKFSTYATNL